MFLGDGMGRGCHLKGWVLYVGEDTPLKQKTTILEVSLGLVKDTV